MKHTLLSIVLFISFFSSCKLMRYTGKESIQHPHFKTTIPFTVEKEMAIFIPIGVGTKENRFDFHFDTHALGSMVEGNSPIASSSSFKYLGSSNAKLKTTKGEKMKREYYRVDSIFVGDVVINNVSFNLSPKEEVRDTIFPVSNGLFGVDMMSFGVWKIDFETKMLTFASSIDSIDHIEDKAEFAKSDLFNVFNTEVVINNLKTKVAIDFGSNAGINLQLNKMKTLSNFSDAKKHEGKIKTTAGVSSFTSYRLYDIPVTINGMTIHTNVFGSDRQTKSIIGLTYFKKFKYVVIDYPDKKMYVSREQF